MARLILALLVMATALPDRARAEVSPAFDASREQLLLESPRSLRRDWKAPRQLRDGLIRARLRPSKDQPAELLVRGGSGSGLALQISRHDMTLLRVDEGRRTTLAGPRHLHRTRGVREMDFFEYRKQIAAGARFDQDLTKAVLPPSAVKKMFGE